MPIGPPQMQPSQGDPYGMPASAYPAPGGMPPGVQPQLDPQMVAQQQAMLQAQQEAERQAEAVRQIQRDRLSAQIEMLNIADEEACHGLGIEPISHTELNSIGYQVVEDYEMDKASRADWEKRTDEGMRMVKLFASAEGQQSFVANVRYPALAMAAIQFHARAYPNIVKGRDVVKCRVQGKDPTESQRKRSERIQDYMSYDILEIMEGWEEDTDQLLMNLPIVGCAFRKTYRDFLNNRNASEMVMAGDLVIPYYAKTLEKAQRVTQWLEFTPNEIEERIRTGVWRDFKPGTASTVKEGTESTRDSRDRDQPHVFLEQHRWWDLDKDGYQEPYVVMVHLDTKQVVRITARYDSDGVHRNKDGEILRIDPVHYFTRFIFLPAFDSGIYGMGFGELIGHLNQIINVTINQLLDAGALQNGPPGFIGKGAKSLNKDRMLRLKPRQWYYVDITGDDLKKNLVPIPTGAPSDVLFKLLGMMVEVAKEIASNVDLLGGSQPQANVPATTTLALIEQGLKVFSDIYKRIHRSLKAEFKKLERLVKLYVSDEDLQGILNDPDASIGDYWDKDMHIVPISDEADLTDLQKITKAQALKETMGMGADDREILRRYYEALAIDDVDKLLGDGPPPNPMVQIKQAEVELKQIELQIKAKEVEVKQIESQAKAGKSQSEAGLIQAKTQTEQLEQQLQALQAQRQIDEQRIAELEALSKIHERHTRTALDAADMLHQHQMDRHAAVINEGTPEGKSNFKMLAEGGPLKPGDAAIVGERGPEMVVPTGSFGHQVIPIPEANRQYVRPGVKSFFTQLNPEQEGQFREWVANNQVPFRPEQEAHAPGNREYDMRGFWLGQQNGDPNARQAINSNDGRVHYSDHWKTPYHPTFSRESQFATPNAPRWANDHQLVNENGDVVFDELAARRQPMPGRPEPPSEAQ